MIVFLGVFSAIALLALIVYALHKFQQKEKEESVDRNSPLPPLPPPQMLDDGGRASRRVQDEKDWSLEVKSLKESGQFRAALDVCKSAYPQMGAFKQACVLLRAEIREERRRGKSVQECLAELYRVSAMAAFFHEKIADSPAISASTLRSFRCADFDHLVMPYKQLGHTHLKLLTPTDIKMLEDMWGPADSHQHVREFHHVAWQEVLANSASSRQDA